MKWISARRIFLSVALTLLLSSPAISNTLTGSGHIYNTPMGGKIDNWYFAVGTAGEVVIDVTRDGGRDFDSHIYLFRNDGSLTFDDFIASNDDYASSLASHLDPLLNPGSYLLRVSEYFFDYPGTQLYEDTVNGDWYYNVWITGEQVAFGASTVPEPATVLLLGGGLAGFWFWGRRKRS